MIGRFVASVQRDVGRWLLLAGLVLAALLYAPTLRRGLVNFDDTWLIAANWILDDASLATLQSILFDLDRDTRLVLGAEYLPIRDLSVMLDIAIWGDVYPGFHLTNLVVYLTAIALWFFALVELGIDRRVAGIAILIWAVHPTHAESVAWISERKGLLGIAFSGLAALGYAKYRAGARIGWLVLAAVAAVCAVWSKALAAFAIASFVALEVALPMRRVSWRRSLASLACMAVVTGAAFVPVLVVASNMSVIAGDVPAPGGHGWFEMVAGVHGFYVRLATLAVENSISYPITTDGPTATDIVLGIVALILVVAMLARFARFGDRWNPSPTLRAASVIWLAGWFPASRIVLPVRLVVAADRYLLFASLGFALALAVGIAGIRRRSIAIALATTIVAAAGVRTMSAQAMWEDPRILWARAVESSPRDGTAWSMYAEALADAGDADAAAVAVDEGLRRTNAPRLQLRRALLLLRRGDRDNARVWLQRAADAGEAIAMTNLALVLEESGDLAAALTWARKAVATAPLYVAGYRNLGRIARASGQQEEALGAFRRAHALEPRSCVNRYNLALAVSLLGNAKDARRLLDACANDPALGARVRSELETLAR